ncbi:Asp-tRNA(Asn)/Glu-tRNA(Gln) amidotransferase subunit GatA [Aminipila sp.]|uniref:Asp-tRNA(Asn)/Glu-tRNA(Gln) amidotransferase subunit GatA n=1 Tax=Aminipila sp. TaxID=2060095 RepID=UPI00289A13A6|nr:Asp-tRNA(Asn)/Glu-tRNA(Gln) amidotransferase subunit GatA [Aminipila sp.]
MAVKELRALSAVEIGRLIRNREVSCKEVTKYYLGEINNNNGNINAVLTVNEEEAVKTAESIQKRINNGENISPLAGVPVIVKDNICTKGIKTTAASKMLENFVPPYSSGAMEKLEKAGAVVLGKANMDEFAMGGSTETSYFGITKNPWNMEYVPGGSSGGSAAAVAANMAPYALGSDTGGSIRQPCAFCNLTGIKPTYGSVSRYGLMAYASSLDQIGPIGKNVQDCAEILTLISGRDKRDSTSVMERPFDFSDSYREDLKGVKIGIPINYFGSGINHDVREKILAGAGVLRGLGAELQEFEMPGIEYAVPAYYIVACAEASSNLSRYDGIKYGFRSKNAKDLLETYYKSRSEGFGSEVKRRIMLGSFVLSSGYFDAYYKKALQVRTMIKENFNKAFEKYDMILSPVSPTSAYKIGEQISDPIAMYMADIYTVSVNLAGIPAVALPCGISDENNMPVGMQLIGNNFSEPALVKAAYAFQQVTNFHKRGGIL